MREIKFRAWDKSRGKFFRGNMSNILLGLDGMPFWQFGSDAPEPYPEHIELQQYTGLKDKNGANIYEGDVLRASSIEGANLEVFWRLDFGVIDRNIGGAQWRMTDLPDRVENVLHDHEVIGNIHENPDLLKA